MKGPKEMALLAAKALSDKKGREIQVLEIGELTTLADYFVIATGSSNTQAGRQARGYLRRGNAKRVNKNLHYLANCRVTVNGAYRFRYAPFFMPTYYVTRGTGPWLSRWESCHRR